MVEGAQLLEFNQVIAAVKEIASQLGREGIDRSAVGAAFTVGDEKKVMKLSQQIGINPFKGYSISVLNRKNWELIKKYAVAVEGAFIVNKKGVILAADRHLLAKVKANVPSGLGTRHRGVAGMTAATKTTGIVVSEGDRKVRIFKDGRIIGTINPLNS